MRYAAQGDSEQLPLEIGPSRGGVLPDRIRPMLPEQAERPFDDPDWFFEPWWPGTLTLAYVEDGQVRLQSEHLADPMAAFPELGSMAEQFADDALLVEGWLLVLDDDGRPDAELLRRRLAGHDELHGTAALVAADLLYASGQSQLGLPFEERRRRLARVLTDGDRAVTSRGLLGEGEMLADAVRSMGLSEVSAREVNGHYRPGTTSDLWLRIPVTESEAAPTRPLLTLLQRLPL